MVFRTYNNLVVRFDRPSPETLERETLGQMEAMRRLCQTLAHDGVEVDCAAGPSEEYAAEILIGGEPR